MIMASRFKHPAPRALVAANRMGVFVGGANVKQVSEDEGKKNVLESSLAK